MRKSVDYSFRAGKPIVQRVYPDLYSEITKIVEEAERGFNQAILDNLFVKSGWHTHSRTDFIKSGIAVQIELTDNAKLYEDIFKLMLLHKANLIHAGVIISPMETGETKERLKLNTSLMDVNQFLQGDCGTLLTVPIWYIGID